MHRLAIDPRALAVVRIGFGLFVAGSCLTRLPDAASFYSDHGPLPREVRIGELASTLNPTALRPWSLLFLDGSGAWSTVVVLAGAVLGVLVAQRRLSTSRPARISNGGNPSATPLIQASGNN